MTHYARADSERRPMLAYNILEASEQSLPDPCSPTTSVPRDATTTVPRGFGPQSPFASFDAAERDGIPSRLIHDVCELIDCFLGKLEPTLGRVASSLGMHDRTLERRLSAAGVTFAQLRDQVRCSRAERLLAHPSKSLADISHELGYAEQSAFSRAFRKWTGRTPKAFRLAMSSQKALNCRKAGNEDET